MKKSFLVAMAALAISLWGTQSVAGDAAAGKAKSAVCAA